MLWWVTSGMSTRWRSPVTFQCLYNVASLSPFTLCLSRKSNVGRLSYKLGVVNVVSSTVQVFPVLQSPKSLLSSRSVLWWVTSGMFSLSASIGFSIYLVVSFYPFAFLHSVEHCKNKMSETVYQNVIIKHLLFIHHHWLSRHLKRQQVEYKKAM